MEEVTPCKGASPFHEETLLFTPLPQATSTVNKRPDLLPKPEIIMEPDKESPDPKNSYLSDGLNVINELRLQLNNLCLNKPKNLNSKDVICDPPLSNRLDKIIENINQSKITISYNDKSQSAQIKNTLSISDQKSSDSFHTPNSQPDTSKSKTLLPLDNCADISIPNNEFSLPPYNFGNNSLPVIPDLNISNNLVNLSLPTKPTVAVQHDIPSNQLPSFMSAFTPLNLVPEDVKRNTFTLDAVSIIEDKERSTAREKALKVIGSLDIAPDKDLNCSDTYSQSFQPTSPGKEDESGFSQLMSKSDFQKDESWCAANYGLPIKPGEESFSFLSASQVSLDFMPPDDSLLRELGCTDPPKYRHTKQSEITFSTPSDKAFNNLQPEETPKTSHTFNERNDRVRESSKNVKDIFSELDTSACSSIVTTDLDQYLKKQFMMIDNGRATPELMRDSYADRNSDLLHVSEIARALKDVPLDATPNSLVKRVMELSDRTNISSKSIQDGINESERCYYEKTVVYGGIIHVDMPIDCSDPQKLLSFADLDTTQVRAVIKTTTNPVKVVIFPLVRKNIIVKVCEVEFKKNDRYFERLHIIKLSVENPQLEISSAELNFGLVPICGVVKLPLKIKSKNSNMLVICPHIEQCDKSAFSIEFDDDSEEEIHLAPLYDATINVIIRPTNETICDVSKVISIFDRLKLCLSSLLGSETLCQIELKAQVYLCRLQVQNSVLEKPIRSDENRQVYFKNSSICPINVKLRSSGQFNLSISSLTMKPNQISDVIISFSSNQTKDIVEGELILSVVPGDLDHIIELKGISSNDTANSSLCTVRELSARSSGAIGSVNSTMTLNNCSDPEGPLQLECTSTSIAWPSISVGLSNQSNQLIKSVYIRSKSACKEKLLIEVDDPANSFYILSNERELKKYEEVVLKPQDSKQISVVFSPKIRGQLKAQIIIKRMKSTSESDSKQLSLYGFGGCANFRAHNVVMDLVSRQCKLSLKSDFSQQFSLQNVGDGLGFFCLSQCKLEGMDLIVSPMQGLIGQGEVRTISLTLQPNYAGSEYSAFQQLLSRDRSTDIKLSTLTIKYGDESTRLRLARLYRKFKNQPKLQKSQQVSSALKSIAELFPINRQKMECVSSLKDSLSSLYDLLYNEGIKEMNVDIIIPRKTVEDANLEVTQQFVDLSEHSQLDETEYTTFLDNTQASHITFNFNDKI